MNQANETGARLVYLTEHESVTNITEINRALAPFGSRIWSLDYTNLSNDVRKLLNQVTLDTPELTRVRDYFLQSREQLLQIIEKAGRTPQIQGGGEMGTLDLTHNVTYPELYIVVPGVDYSRFDRFHVNVSSDGTGVDEVMQVLSGGGVRLLQHLPDRGLVTLEIDCPNDESGWVLTYSGAYPHIGSISGAQEGTKVLMQVIGPSQWEMKYEQ